MNAPARLRQGPRPVRWPRARGVLDFLLHPELRTSWGGPFNGQRGRQQLFRELTAAFNFSTIVETGAHRGTTTAFLHDESPAHVHTVESAPRFFGFCTARFFRHRRVTVHHGDSRAVLSDLLPSPALRTGPVFFYLDAHWYVDMPLVEECRLILEHQVPAVIMIDDFEVPDDPGYLFDAYEDGRRLTLAFLEEFRGGSMEAFFPACPSADETGSRRGCIVLGTTPEINARLRTISALRHRPAAFAP